MTELQIHKIHTNPIRRDLRTPPPGPTEAAASFGTGSRGGQVEEAEAQRSHTVIHLSQCEEW